MQRLTMKYGELLYIIEAFQKPRFQSPSSGKLQSRSHLSDAPTEIRFFLCNIISCHIIFIMLYHIIPFHFISYHFISYHIISYHIISFHIISYEQNHFLSHIMGVSIDRVLPNACFLISILEAPGNHHNSSHLQHVFHKNQHSICKMQDSTDSSVSKLDSIPPP